MPKRPPRLVPPEEPPTRPGWPAPPPPLEQLYVPPPPADAPFWLHPLVLGGAIGLALVLALVLWFLPGEPPPDDLTPEEVAALLAEPPESRSTPPAAWDVPTRSSDLRLSTDPAGAIVRINSEWLGMTPLDLDDLPPGFYTLRLTKADYHSRDTSFYLASGSFLHLDIRLEPEQTVSDLAPSSLAADRPRPAASPRRPSAPVRRTPAPSEPPRRQIRQEGRPSGGGAPATEFEVASPEDVRQISHTGSLTVTSNPPGAIVLVDGVPFGRAPLSLSDLRPGSYVVTLALPGHVPLSYQAEVTAGSVAVVKGIFPQPIGG